MSSLLKLLFQRDYTMKSILRHKVQIGAELASPELTLPCVYEIRRGKMKRNIVNVVPILIALLLLTLLISIVSAADGRIIPYSYCRSKLFLCWLER